MAMPRTCRNMTLDIEWDLKSQLWHCYFSMNRVYTTLEKFLRFNKIMKINRIDCLTQAKIAGKSIKSQLSKIDTGDFGGL